MERILEQLSTICYRYIDKAAAVTKSTCKTRISDQKKTSIKQAIAGHAQRERMMKGS